MIRGPKPICRHPFYFTVTITLRVCFSVSNIKTQVLIYRILVDLLKIFIAFLPFVNTHCAFQLLRLVRI